MPELLGGISLLSPEYLLSVERWPFHSEPPDHYDLHNITNYSTCCRQFTCTASIEYLYAEDPTLTKEEYDNYHSFVRLRQGTEEKVLSVCPRLASGMMSTITKIDFANTAAFQPV